MKLKDGIHSDIKKFTYLNQETIITPFFTNDYCDHLINRLEKHGWKVDENGNYDMYLNEIEDGKEWCRDFLEIIKKDIEPEIVKNWTEAIKGRLWKYYPVPFAKKFSLKGQSELDLHVDNALITFFVKLNDNFGGCDTVFPRQKWDTSNLKKGEMLIIPGIITHPHYTKKLTWGEKYSLVGRVSILDVRESKEYSDNIESVISDIK
tara:strand:+ start:386 stop:1003 length:618 start_codon:yes stop_codon:yes gene_type:complete